jgi:hypothetical protein
MSCFCYQLPIPSSKSDSHLLPCGSAFAQENYNTGAPVLHAINDAASTAKLVIEAIDALRAWMNSQGEALVAFKECFEAFDKRLDAIERRLKELEKK